MTIQKPTSPKFDRILFGAIIIALISLAFCRLGAGEIKSWDEALYLVRAQSIEQHGSWLDQTKYALGGLYSSSHPPLGIWAFTFAREILGHSTFADRLPSALAYLASITTLYLLLRTSTSKAGAIISAASLASAQTYVLYAHRAQLDAMLMMWMLISAYFFVLSLNRDRLSFALCGGITFGCALLTKFGFGLLLLPFATTLCYQNREWKKLLLFCGIGVLIGAPWYFWMSSNYPDFGLHAEQLIRSRYYDVQISKPWYYYINQCIINLPLLLPALLALTFHFSQYPKDAKRKSLLWPTTLWFASVFILLAFMATKMAHFATLLFPPLAILIGCAADNIQLRGWKFWLVSLCACGSIVWSLSEQFRLLVSHRMSLNLLITPDVTSIAVLSLLSLILLYVCYRQPSRLTIISCLSLFLACIQLTRLISYSPSIETDGAVQIIAALQRSHIDSVGIVIGDAPNADLSPQLRYYAQEAGLSTAKWKTAHASERNERLPATIIEHGNDRFAKPDNNTSSLIEKLATAQHSHRVRTRSYDLLF